MNDQEKLFCELFDAVSAEVHDTAVRHGFWDEERNRGEIIALMHSELSEALEGLRHGNPPDEHCPEYSSVEVELADCIIRIMDMAYADNLDVAGAIMAKMRFNEQREFKHGKAF